MAHIQSHTLWYTKCHTHTNSDIHQGTHTITHTMTYTVSHTLTHTAKHTWTRCHAQWQIQSNTRQTDTHIHTDSNTNCDKHTQQVSYTATHTQHLIQSCHGSKKKKKRKKKGAVKRPPLSTSQSKAAYQDREDRHWDKLQTLTLLEFLLQCLLHELDGRIPLRFVRHRPVLKDVQLYHSLRQTEHDTHVTASEGNKHVLSYAMSHHH